MEIKERAIGEVFNIQGIKLKTIKGDGCNNCYFIHKGCGRYEIEEIIGVCDEVSRKDKTGVIFVEQPKP